MKLKSPSFVCSSATGLAGLPESRFLSCFLEHYAPMCGFADAVSVRDGLVHAFVGRWMVNTPSYIKPVRDPAEVMRGHALECSLFSAMAIGGLALGCPASSVYRHLNAARRNLTKCQDLREPPVVSALVLYGVANALLPPCKGGGGQRQQQQAQQQQEAQKQEYLTSLDNAQALFESLPVKDPRMTAFLTYRTICDNLVFSLLHGGYSVNPANINGRYDAALGIEAGGAAGGDDGFDGGGGGGEQLGGVPGQRAHAPPTRAVHPSYVVADTMTLIFRYVCAETHGESGVRSGWRHTHDFVEAELDRLSRENAGAMVLTTLAGNLVAIKSRVGTTEGMLPTAEMALEMFFKCPGLMRHYSLHNAHLVLTVFKLFNKRKSYDALRDQLVMATANEIATFDEFDMGVPICDTHICTITSDLILGMSNMSVSGGGGSSVPPGHGNLGVLGNTPRGQHQHQQQQQQSGRPPRPFPPMRCSRTVRDRDGSANNGTSGTSGGGPSDPAGAREGERPVVRVGSAKGEIIWYPEKVAVSPRSDTNATAPATAAAWPAAAWGDSGPAVGVDAPSTAAAVPPGAARCTVPSASDDRIDGRQQQIGAWPWAEPGAGWHRLARGGGSQQQQQDLSSVHAVSPRPNGVSFSPRGTGVPSTPTQGDGTAARGGPQYYGGGGGGEGCVMHREGDCFGGVIPQVPWDNTLEDAGEGRARAGGKRERGDRSGDVSEYQPHERTRPSASLSSSATAIGIAPVLESLRAQTAAKQERQRRQHEERQVQQSAGAGVPGRVPDATAHDQVDGASLPPSAGAAPAAAAAEEERVASGSGGNRDGKGARVGDSGRGDHPHRDDRSSRSVSGGGGGEAAGGGDTAAGGGRPGGPVLTDLVGMLLDD